MYLYPKNEFNIIKEKCNIYFREISGGVYQVVKDRWNIFPQYVDAKIVATELSKTERIAIQRADGFILTNYLFSLNSTLTLKE